MAGHMKRKTARVSHLPATCIVGNPGKTRALFKSVKVSFR
jgi:hypothetical protein